MIKHGFKKVANFSGYALIGAFAAFISEQVFLKAAAFFVLASAIAGDRSAESWILVAWIPAIIIVIVAFCVRQAGLAAGALATYSFLSFAPQPDARLEMPPQTLEPQKQHDLIGIPQALGCGAGCLAFLEKSPSRAILVARPQRDPNQSNIALYKAMPEGSPCSRSKETIRLMWGPPTRCLRRQPDALIDDALILENCRYAQGEWQGCFFERAKPIGISSANVETVYEIIDGHRTMLARHYTYTTGGFGLLSLASSHHYEKGEKIFESSFLTMVFGPTEGQIKGNAKYKNCKVYVPCTMSWSFD